MNTGIPGHDMAILTMTADQLLYIVAGVGKTRNETKRNKQNPRPQIYKSSTQAPYSKRIFSVFSCAMAHPRPQQC